MSDDEHIGDGDEMPLERAARQGWYAGGQERHLSPRLPVNCARQLNRLRVSGDIVIQDVDP